MERLYLDTYTLVEAVVGKSSSSGLARKTIDRISSRGYDVYLPQIVIGEAFLKVIQRSKPSEYELNVKLLLDHIRTLMPTPEKFKSCTPVPEKEILELALQIKEEQTNLDYNDALIAAHAVLDKEAKYLYTIDQEVHRSTVIEQKIAERIAEGNKFYVIDYIK